MDGVGCWVVEVADERQCAVLGKLLLRFDAGIEG